MRFGEYACMHIDKKFDKANRIVDSYMIYEKSGEVEISLSVSEVGFWLRDVFAMCLIG